MNKNIIGVRLALLLVLAATLICLVLDVGYSLEDKEIPTDILSMQDALKNNQTLFAPMTIVTPDSIAYVFSNRGNHRLDNNSVSKYNLSEIIGTNMAYQGNFSDAEASANASANITAAFLHNYLAANVPLNRNLDLIFGNGTRLSHYLPANYSSEEKLLLIYSLFDYLKKQENNRDYQLLYANDSEYLMDAAFSPDNQTIAISSTALSGPDESIHLLDMQTKKKLFELANCSPYGKMAFRPDGKVIASGTNGLMIRISDCRTGKELKNVSQNGSVELLAFSPDGKILASTGNIVRDTWIPMLWNTVDNSVISGNPNAYRSAKIRTEGHSDKITDMAFNPNGVTLATSSYDNTTKIWSAKDGRQLFNLIHDGPVLGLAYSPDGKMLATASEDGMARIWDAENGTLLIRVNHSGPVQAIAFDPKPLGGLGWVIATINSGNLTYWQASTGDEVGEAVFENSPLSSVVFSPEGMVAASSKDGLVRLFSEDLFTLLDTFNPNSTLKSIAFSPNGTELAILCDKSLLIWDISSLIGRMNNTNNDTNNEIINLNNNSTISNMQMHSGRDKINNYMTIVDASSDNPAILLSAFCEKMGIDARIIAEYGASGDFENMSGNLSSDNLHLYAEAYLGKLNSSERNDIEMAVDRIRQRYNASDVYSHVNLSTDDIWLNLDVASEYPGGPFEDSQRQMPVYSSRNNESYESTNATSIKENKQPLSAIEEQFKELSQSFAASNPIDANNKENVGNGNIHSDYTSGTNDNAQSDFISTKTPTEMKSESTETSTEMKSENPKTSTEMKSENPETSTEMKSENPETSTEMKSENPVTSTEMKSEKNAIPSKHSGSDNDDLYKIKTDHEPVEIESNEPAVSEEAAMEPAAKNATSAPKIMGSDNHDSESSRDFLKWMGLIAGGFIIIIATAYRGREPPMDDDDFDDIEYKRPSR